MNFTTFKLFFTLCALTGICVPAAMAQEVSEQPTVQAQAEKCLNPIEGMSCIEGGYFLRGYNDDPHSHCKQPSYNKKKVTNTHSEATIWLDTYYMDVTEVTTKAYKDCVKAKKCKKSGPKYIDFDRAQQPITGVSWYEAEIFCKSQGKHLPTEAEWEAAVRGKEGEMYPWGNEPVANCENSVIMNEAGRSCGTKKRGNGPDTGRVLEVCSKPKGRYGLCDMIGNAEEWVADWYSHSYDECGESCQGKNPQGPCQGADTCDGHRYKVVKGGSWYWPAEHATGIHRRSHVPSNDPYHHFGFRCAASQKEMQDLLKKEEIAQP